jgi:uncharacterized protein (TIGR04255 family)
METPKLPTYGKPPIIEVVSGVMFDPLPTFRLPLVGKFWIEQLSDFQSVEEQPPLAPTVELLGRDRGLMFVAEPFPMPRVWFANARRDQVIQVQRDRFLCNWRKVAPSHEYPRFTQVIEFFYAKLGAYEQFLAEQCKQPPVSRQYELTYVNHIDVVASGAEPLEEIGKLLPDFSWRGNGSRWLPAPEDFDVGLAFLLPDNAGRLRVRLNTGRRMYDQKSVIVLEITARGHLDDREKWFALAHVWIVKAFEDLVSASMDGVWEKR